MPNKLYYGDNLTVLRESIAADSVDLIYLDPPFNSNASYNVLFKAPSGEQSAAQIEAFEDTWHWNESAERAFDEVVTGPHSDAAIMLRAMRSALGLHRHGRACPGHPRSAIWANARRLGLYRHQQTKWNALSRRNKQSPAANMAASQQGD
ncbi:MAG: hypothetical protein WCF20_09515 [Methylovirgula sp.]